MQLFDFVVVVTLQLQMIVLLLTDDDAFLMLSIKPMMLAEPNHLILSRKPSVAVDYCEN